MADDQDDPLIREVTEELRQEQAQQLWKKYGSYVIGAALVLIAGVGGFEYWKGETQAKQEALSAQFTSAQDLAGEEKWTEALSIFETVAQEGGGYGMLARFQKAAVMAQSGDLENAASAYDALANETDAAIIYRDTAVILGAMVRLNMEDANLGQVKQKLSNLDQGGSALRFSARELTALAALKEGLLDEATTTLEKLASDQEAPLRMRQRAGELIGLLRP